MGAMWPWMPEALAGVSERIMHPMLPRDAELEFLRRYEGLRCR